MYEYIHKFLLTQIYAIAASYKAVGATFKLTSAGVAAGAAYFTYNHGASVSAHIGAGIGGNIYTGYDKTITTTFGVPNPEIGTGLTLLALAACFAAWRYMQAQKISSAAIS